MSEIHEALINLDNDKKMQLGDLYKSIDDVRILDSQNKYWLKLEKLKSEIIKIEECATILINAL